MHLRRSLSKDPGLQTTGDNVKEISYRSITNICENVEGVQKLSTSLFGEAVGSRAQRVYEVLALVFGKRITVTKKEKPPVGHISYATDEHADAYESSQAEISEQVDKGLSRLCQSKH